MTKQRFAAGLWFMMGWMLGGMASAFLGFPAWTGLCCATFLAAAVLMDPVGIFNARDHMTEAAGAAAKSRLEAGLPG
jgi:hypothetical protein